MKKVGVIIGILLLVGLGVFLLPDEEQVSVQPPPPPEQLTLEEYIEMYPNFDVEVDEGVVYATNSQNSKVATIFDTNGFLGQGWKMPVFGGQSKVLLSSDSSKIAFMMFLSSAGQRAELEYDYRFSSRMYIYHIDKREITLLIESPINMLNLWRLGNKWENNIIYFNEVYSDIDLTHKRYTIDSSTGEILSEELNTKRLEGGPY